VIGRILSPLAQRLGRIETENARSFPSKSFNSAIATAIIGRVLRRFIRALRYRRNIAHNSEFENVRLLALSGHRSFPNARPLLTQSGHCRDLRKPGQSMVGAWY
jgi:hypothetical protein